MGSIRFMNVLEDMHIDVMPHFAEVNTLTYGTRVNLKKLRFIVKCKKSTFSTYDKDYLSDCFDKIENYIHIL